MPRPVCFLALLLLPIAACGGPKETAPAAAPVPLASHAEWARDAAIYEVNVRQFTPEGTFTALMPHLARLDDLGVDILWLMPVQPIGVDRRKGSLGSYYSISDYRKMNPEFGAQADLKAVIDSAHALGMKVILDWVANHTSHDHVWTVSHPDWYVRNAAGQISNALDRDGKETDWTDVAELDFSKPDMRAAMIDDMKWWLTDMGLDGFRCDVAWGVPLDFWTSAHTALVAVKPDLFMLAEEEGPTMHAAFDASYGWSFHHLLNGITQGKEPVAKLDEYLAKESEYPANAYRMYFTSNHDENSWQGTEFERMGDDHLAAFVLASTMTNSFPLLYTGQEARLSKRLRFFDKDTVSFADTTLVPFYRTMFATKASTPALWNGADGGVQAKLAGTGSADVYAFTRSKGESQVVVAVNFGDAAATYAYSGLAAPGAYRDIFTGKSVELGAAGSIALKAHGYAVYVR
jgi:alpha-amylase